MKKIKMIKYIAAERDTPDVPRVWGNGKTDLIARLQCEIALREKLIGKLERGCTEGVCSPHRYFIESETEYKKNNKGV
jgi:hypothetical protein|tara:strand:+ start:82 stop:315 length:234 start_codon:yes stop_codon:yes gene_type:complete